MIDEILNEAIKRIEKAQASNPENYMDVEDELNNLKKRMKELKDFLQFPILKQLENIDKEEAITDRRD